MYLAYYLRSGKFKHHQKLTYRSSKSVQNSTGILKQGWQIFVEAMTSWIETMSIVNCTKNAGFILPYMNFDHASCKMKRILRRRYRWILSQSDSIPNGFYFQLSRNDKSLGKGFEKSGNTLEYNDCGYKNNRPSHMKKHVIIHHKIVFTCPFSNCHVKRSEKEKLAPHLAEKHQIAHSEALKIAARALVKPPLIINDNSKPKKPRRAKKLLNSKNYTVVHDLEDIRNLLENQSDNENWHL